MNIQRRTFILHSAAAGGALAAANLAWAQAGPVADMVQETDAAAMAVGYVPDAGKADRKKYPTYASGQRCGTCILFEGRPTDMAGPCPLFPGKRVSAAGWCSSWAKKQ